MDLTNSELAKVVECRLADLQDGVYSPEYFLQKIHVFETAAEELMTRYKKVHEEYAARA